ncbi:unnamed protein product [Dimorphilus gyrociliatus]|uniref:3-beta hydroxysteroid dehydrogenase/isomerase domain-containing protein n=1 Tax=Dimorphilus gyrociliatus TaxID=2664684 RepID=A0A7I8W5C9_9ANNE|nr:unnamed protein product [Dimorphilus gyrociliatus]
MKAGLSNTKAEVHVVTGGAGYLGQKLGLKLAEEGIVVRLFDIRPPKNLSNLPKTIKFYEGNILDEAALSDVLREADCVHHVASYGMSGREMLNKELIRRVNVNGTRLLIKICKSLNVSRLIYTSTYNVIFGGQEIKNGNETLPYWPVEKHTDEYSRTKCLAEQLVLESNSPSFKTCALRLAAIYGPGEERHFPRIIKYMEQGLFAFTYGDAIVDFVHVDNVVNCHILSSSSLKNGKAAGQSYFVSDGAPIKNWDFMKPFVEGLGYKYPNLKIPTKFIFYIAFVIEILYLCFSSIYNFQPLLTRAEVYKTGVSHYFSIEKAKRDLNYQPVRQNDVQSMAEWFKSRGYYRKKQKSHIGYYIMLCIMIILFLSMMPVAY